MENKELDRLEKLKLNAIENPSKKKRGCTSCKKKPKDVVVENPPLPFELEEDIFIPTQDDIKVAYAELTSIIGVKEDKKEFIGKVFQFLFNETFDWGCRSCVNKQARRFRIYVTGK
jgi:hypothetical protein